MRGPVRVVREKTFDAGLADTRVLLQSCQKFTELNVYLSRQTVHQSPEPAGLLCVFHAPSLARSHCSFQIRSAGAKFPARAKRSTARRRDLFDPSRPAPVQAGWRGAC